MAENLEESRKAEETTQPEPVYEERNATLDDEPTPAYEERNATLDDEPTPLLSADEVQDSILEDSGMNAFQKYCARMDDKRWALAQRVTGALLGIAAGVALFWDTLVKTEAAAQQQGLFSLPLIIAIVIALAVPNIIEKQSLRSVPKLRTAMVIALALVIVIYFLVLGAQTGFRFTEPAGPAAIALRGLSDGLLAA